MSTQELYVGVDIGKKSHSAFLLSKDLHDRLQKKWRKYPRLRFENSREGFQQLLSLLTSFAAPEHCHLLTESTGHYGANLEQFLSEHGIRRYRIIAHKRYGRDKTDELDAQALAFRLYNQEALGVLIADRREQAHAVVEPIPAARKLRGLVQTYNELVQRRTAIYNKLTAISDELFTELREVYANVHSPSALNLRDVYPTPESVAAASLDDLCATRKRTLPMRDDLARLQELAVTSIGTKDPERRGSLLIEQRLLIKEVRPLSESIDELKSAIDLTLSATRQGQILQSFTGVGPINGAALLAAIGTIANFESASRLRGYLGCAPKRTQTGTSTDRANLDRSSGKKDMRKTMFLVVSTAIKYDPTWKALYDRLVDRMCSYDARKKRVVGKLRVLYRVAGQMIFVIYRLLKKDDDLVRSFQGKPDELPKPELYEVAKHHIMVGKAGGKHSDHTAGARSGKT